jgi:hypothetical protein
MRGGVRHDAEATSEYRFSYSGGKLCRKWFPR